MRATYSFVRIITTTHSRLDSRLSYGFVSGPGAHQTTVSAILGFVAVVCSTTNVVGGFVITDRMLKMFKRKSTPAPKKKDQQAG